MLSRTRDGTRRAAPRELIHLLEAARSAQLHSLEIGQSGPTGELLFSAAAVKEALPEVSLVRLEQTVYAEYPAERSYIEAMEAAEAEQTPNTLAALWRVGREEAIKRAQRLVKIGFFEIRGTAADPTFWVPFLYRDSLRLVQGAAE